MRSKYFSVLTETGVQIINADHVVLVKEINGRTELSMSNGDVVKSTLDLTTIWGYLEQAFEVSLHK